MNAGGEAGCSSTAGLHPVQSAEVTAALEEVGRLGPYFALGLGLPAGPGWLPVRRLYEDLRPLAGLSARVAAAIGTDETRVAVSILVQGYAARLWSAALATSVRHGMVPDLDPDALLWRDHEGSVSLHLDPVGGWRGERLDALLAQVVVAEHLRPLVVAVRRLCSVSDRPLWDNIASALLGAARVLDGGPRGPARLVAERVWRRSCEPDDASALFRTGRRATCCLYYRVPGGGVCGDCVFSSPPHTTARRA